MLQDWKRVMTSKEYWRSASSRCKWVYYKDGNAVMTHGVISKTNSSVLRCCWIYIVSKLDIYTVNLYTYMRLCTYLGVYIHRHHPPEIIYAGCYADVRPWKTEIVWAHVVWFITFAWSNWIYYLDVLLNVQMNRPSETSQEKYTNKTIWQSATWNCSLVFDCLHMFPCIKKGVYKI